MKRQDNIALTQKAAVGNTIPGRAWSIFSASQPTTFRAIRYVMVCLALIPAIGCQSLMIAKQKAKKSGPQDKFSCGEPLPGRNGTVSSRME